MHNPIKLLLGSICMALTLSLMPAMNCLAEESYAEDYERDFIQKLYTSDDGLDGTSVNCVFSDADGLIWIGSYSGLYSYDSKEFHHYEIADHTVAVRCITQDDNGVIWIGTNGDGIYSYDGTSFQSLPIENEELLTYTINDIEVDENGTLWAASGDGLLTSSDMEKAVTLDAGDAAGAVRDLEVLPDKTVICVGRNGTVMRYQDGGIEDITPKTLSKQEKVRCVALLNDARILLGTNANTILEIDARGNVLKTISSGDVSSINNIHQIDETSAWVCADNSIAVLQGETLNKVNLKGDNSVEMVCEDYQGNYWFASSRNGLLHLYENRFANLGNYLGISGTVNCTAVYHGDLYVGTDEGLACYRGRSQVVTDLVRQCEGVRVRQLLVDDADRLWAATNRYGLMRAAADGTVDVFTTDNSGLGTNDLRCLLRGSDGLLYIGSDYGVFTMDQNDEIKRLMKADDSVINAERVLCIAEVSEGTILIGTDGDGMYLIKDGEVTAHKSRADGFQSNVIMKLIKAESKSGYWAVSGAGIVYISKDDAVQSVTGLPATNSLDLIQCGNGEVIVLAGNGLFRLKEADLLEEKPKYQFYSKENGFVVDVTSNAGHCLSDRTLYICGTGGLAAYDLDRERIDRDIRAYIFSVDADGKVLQAADDIYAMSDDVYRLNIDIRLLDYCKDACLVSYYLDGMDQEKAVVPAEALNVVTYTNLKGKTYRYLFNIISSDTGQVLVEKTITLRKEKKFWENPSNLISLFVFLALLLAALISLYLYLKKKRLESRIYSEVMEQRRDEIESVMYRDLVTGAYNRNYYELRKEQNFFGDIKALATVGLNNAEYLQRRKGIIFLEDLLRVVYQILQTYSESGAEIYRVSDYIFCISFKNEIVLEEFTQYVKDSFDQHMKEIGQESAGLSVGAVYKDPLMKEDYRDLFNRCDHMRSLDQKHSESQFIRNKIKDVEEHIFR